jgi:hypothetical protein
VPGGGVDRPGDAPRLDKVRNGNLARRLDAGETQMPGQSGEGNRIYCQTGETEQHGSLDEEPLVMPGETQEAAHASP